jgi:type I restriction enzyme S subunit
MMTPYTTYKPSGIEWIGDIPEHWEVKKIKNSFKLIMGQSPDSGDCNLNGEGIPFLQGNADFGYLFPKPQNWCIKPTKIAPVNSVLLSVRAPIGAVNIADQEYCIGRGLCSLVALNTKFLYFCLDCLNEELNSLGTGSTFKAVSTEQINNTFTVIPPLYEQTAIATYLDRKTAEIDRIIANKQKLIALYEEEKQTIINQAVTRGVDKTVKLKPSGVEWLGDIPEHWGVKKLKWLHGTMSGGTPKTSDSNYYEGDIPWLRSLDLNNGDVTDCEIRITQKAIAESATKIVPLNSVLLAMYGGAGTIGKSGLLKFEATINQAICAIIPNEQTLPEYLHYFVIFYRPYWMIGAEGTRRDPNISQDDIKNREFLFPPSKEQLDIVSYIEKECSRLDTLIVKFKKQIELFQEYRTTLISEVVTGKVKV